MLAHQRHEIPAQLLQSGAADKDVLPLPGKQLHRAFAHGSIPQGDHDCPHPPSAILLWMHSVEGSNDASALKLGLLQWPFMAAGMAALSAACVICTCQSLRFSIRLSPAVAYLMHASKPHIRVLAPPAGPSLQGCQSPASYHQYQPHHRVCMVPGTRGLAIHHHRCT